MPRLWVERRLLMFHLLMGQSGRGEGTKVHVKGTQFWGIC